MLNQGLFGWKVAEQIPVGDAKALRQIPQAAVKPDLGKKSDRTVNNLPLTILRV